jgi:hypothetical protein
VVTEPAHELMANSVPVGIQYTALLTCFWLATLRLVPMADSENSDSPQIKLFHECGRAFHTRDPALLARTTHKDYRYVTHPRSLGHPEQTKEEWLEQWREVMSFLTADSVVSYFGRTSDSLCPD